MRTCSGDDLRNLNSVLELGDCLLDFWLLDVTICYTDSVQVPCEIQLKAAFSDCRDGKDTHTSVQVSADTGSGMTLPIALDVLLDGLDKQFISVTISRFKRLRLQVTDFNTRYGIPMVVIR
jgi:hypothetical protein